MTQFQKKLTRMFEQVEAQFRAETVERYERHAGLQVSAWMLRLGTDEPMWTPESHKSEREFNWDKADSIKPPQYAKRVKDIDTSVDYRITWEQMRDRINAGVYDVDLKQAAKDANDSVDAAKANFIAKQSKKLENATVLRTDFRSMKGSLKCNGVVTGYLHVFFKNGDKFSIHMNMIVNYRYSRGYTSFHQFPARFYDVVLGGEPVKKVSEQWLKDNYRTPAAP